MAKDKRTPEFRAGEKAGIKLATDFLRSETAAHSIMAYGKPQHFEKNHIGPTIMAARLWADWLDAVIEFPADATRTAEQPRKLSAREAMDEMAAANESLREKLKAKIATEDKARFDELVARTCLHSPPGLICQICFNRNETTRNVTDKGDGNG